MATAFKTERNVPSPLRASVALSKPSTLIAGTKFLTLSISSAKSESIKVPFVKARNIASECFKHRAIISSLLTRGSPPEKIYM